MSHKSIFLFAVFLNSVTLHAQAPVRGRVQDPQGKPVDGAALVLYRQSASSPLAQTRSVNGEFVFPDTAAGEYLLEVSADGFRRASLAVHGEKPIDLRLQVAGIDQRVLVTAEGAAQTIDQVSKAASVIDADEIAQRNEYSLGEALRDTPGLLIRNLGGPGQATSVRMRGLRADATAVLIDGLRFRDVATTQGDASSFLSTLNVINFDRVEVLRGSGSSLYGSNAVGGTVNVVSDTGGGATHGGLQMEGGTLGLLRGRATVGGGIMDNKLTYSAGLLHLNVMSGVDGDDRVRSTGLQTFTRYTFGPGSSLAGRVMFSDDFVQPNISPTSSGLPAANIPATTIVRAIPLAPEQVVRSAAGLPIVAGDANFIPSRNDPDNHRASRFWTGALIFRQALHPMAEWVTSYQRVHTNRFFRNGPGGPGFQPAVSNVSQFLGDIDTVDTKISWRPRQWYALTGGYEFEREGYLNLDDNRMPAPETVSARTATAQRSNAAYFANQITLAEQRLQISLSGRAQAFQLDRPRFVYAGAANNYESVATAAPPRALTGDVAVSYFVPRTGTKVRAHGGNSYRAPSLYERYGSGFFYDPVENAVAFSPYGDPRLAPDRYNSVDAGVDQYLFHDTVRISGTWFYTRIVQITQFDSSANIVSAATDPFGRTSGYYNGAGGTSRGLELTAEARPSRWTLFRASYSYVNADTNQDTAVRGFFGALSVPAHSFTALLHQQLGKKNDVTVDLYRSSDYYNALSAGGRARAYLYSGVTKADVVFNRELWSGEKHTLKAYAKVDNVFHQRYFENGFQAPRATFLTGVQVLFK
jgi:iron complex outermembrane receptor protein